MKKLLFSLLSVGVVSVLAFGATRAYFTDTQDVLGNSISTGTINITETTPAWAQVVWTNAKPGDSMRRWVHITNAGTLPIGTLTVSAVNPVGDAELLDNINVSLYGQVTGFDQGIYSPSWGTGQQVSTWLQNVNLLGTPVYVNPGNTAATQLAAGATDVVILDFRIPTTVGNEMQGKTITFTLQFNAEQVH